MALVRIIRADGTVDTITISGSIKAIDVQDGTKVEVLDDTPSPAPAEGHSETAAANVDEPFVVQVTAGTDFLIGNTAGDGVSPIGMVGIAGAHGTLFMFSNGVYEYDLDRKDPQVLALAEGEGLTDDFSYAISDGDGVFDIATLTIDISGTRSGPQVGNDDHAVDDMIASEMIAALDARADRQSGDGDTPNGLTVLGHTGGDKYGLLTLNADGSYGYQLDEANSDVSALGDGETLTEIYTYAVTDGYNTDTATLTVTITGAKNGPATVNATHQLNAVICDTARRA